MKHKLVLFAILAAIMCAGPAHADINCPSVAIDAADMNQQMLADGYKNVLSYRDEGLRMERWERNGHRKTFRVVVYEGGKACVIYDTQWKTVGHIR